MGGGWLMASTRLSSFFLIFSKIFQGRKSFLPSSDIPGLS